MCFVWVWEQTAIISLYSIDWLVFITETKCDYSAVRTASFNIQQFYVLPTQLYLCVLCGSQNKQRLFPYTTLTGWSLGAFAKLRRATIGFVMSVRPRPCVRMEQLATCWMDFLEIWYFSIFSTPEEKIQVWLKPGNKSVYCTWRPICVHSWSYLAQFFLEWEIFQTRL